MPLLEIVRTQSTSDSTLATCVDMAKRVGKTPVVVGNCVGFTANRIFFPYGQAGAMLADFGVLPYRIVRALVAFGMPMGVFQMSDLSGVDIGAYVSGIIANAYGDRTYKSTIGEKLVKAGRLGQKAGKGYYLYPPGARGGKDDLKALQPLLDAARKDAGNSSTDLASLAKLFSEKDLVEICLFPVVNEAFRVVDEGHVVRESDVDIISVMGYGFPSFRGGILHWGRAVGLRTVRDRLQHFSSELSSKAANERTAAMIRAFFAPSAPLQRAADSI